MPIHVLKARMAFTQMHRRCLVEKISSILPSSPRVKAVDVTRSTPVRPGAPSFGRPQGKNSLGDTQEAMAAEERVNLATKNSNPALAAKLSAEDAASLAVDTSVDRVNFSKTGERSTQKNAEQVTADKSSDKVYDRTAAKRNSEMSKTAVAKELAAKFFMESPKTLARDTQAAKSEQVSEDLSENFKTSNLKFDSKSDFPKLESGPMMGSGPAKAMTANLGKIEGMAVESESLSELSN